MKFRMHRAIIPLATLFKTNQEEFNPRKNEIMAIRVPDFIDEQSRKKCREILPIRMTSEVLSLRVYNNNDTRLEKAIQLEQIDIVLN